MNSGSTRQTLGMDMNLAYRRIFRGYVLIFLNITVIIDLLPDVVGYYLIAKGWTELSRYAAEVTGQANVASTLESKLPGQADGGITDTAGTKPEHGGSTLILLRILMVWSVLSEIYRLLGGGQTSSGGFFNTTVPQTPPLVQMDMMIIPSLALFLAGVRVMVQILRTSQVIAAAEEKLSVVRGLERSAKLLARVYAPVGLLIVLMAQCFHFPETIWGNFALGLQQLGTLVYFYFQLMLVLQIANLRKNLDCCLEGIASE